MKKFNFKREWPTAPNIDFLKFWPLLWSFALLSLAHSISKLTQIGQPKTFENVLTIFVSLMIPNLFCIGATFLIINYFNKSFPNRIPIFHFCLSLILIGTIRGEFVTYLEESLHIDGLAHFELHPGFVISFSNISNTLNGALIGLLIGIGITFYSLFCNSPLKLRQSILASRKKLHLEVDQLEYEINRFEEGIEEKIYLEVLDRVDLRNMLKENVSKRDSNYLSELLRGSLTERVRLVSSELLKTKKVPFSLRTCHAMSEFAEANEFYLKPLLFALLNIGVTFGYNAGIGTWRDPAVVFVNSITCGIFLALLNRFAFSWLKNKFTNSNLTMIIAAFCSIISELNGYLLAEPLPIFIRIQRFIFFCLLLSFISFIVNMVKAESDEVAKNEVLVRDLKEKLDYLDNVLRTMRREIAEHLHGFLIFQLTEMAGRIRGKDLTDADVKALLTEIRQNFSYEKYSIITKNFELDLPTLFRLAKEWEGLIAVTYSGDTNRIGLLPNAQKRELWNVIIELINNAFRHGGASEILINLDFSRKNFLSVHAENNGSPINHYPNIGTGSQIFKVASDGNWSIRNRENGGVEVDLLIEFYVDNLDEIVVTSSKSQLEV